MNDLAIWDKFAAAALAGAAANENSGCNSPRDMAHWAASLADSMMLQRAKRDKLYQDELFHRNCEKDVDISK